jgi:hypothetical protein
MIMKSLNGAGLVLALALLGAAPNASATVYTVTYTGVVEPGQNPGGLFGGGDLAGDTFLATFRYDPAVGVRQTIPGVSDKLTGPGAVTGTITINGYTEYFSGSYLSEAYTEPGDMWEESIDAGGERGLLVTLFADPATASLESTIPESGGWVDGGSQVTIEGPDGHGGFTEVLGYSLGPATVSLTAPEPATWALMLAGVGGLGAAMRLRRKMPALAL